MTKKYSFRALSLAVAFLLALGSAVTAFAITIVIDGDQDAVWTTGSGGQTPGSTTDPNESTITDGRDIAAVYWTNDTTNFYLMMQTQAAPSLGNGFTPTNIYFCLDIDNNTATGSSYANCNSMAGIDRYILIGNSNAPVVYDSAQTQIGTGTLGYNTAAATPVIEVSVALSDLGLTPATCTQTIPMVVYFDNGTTEPDDNTPDSGTINIGCGAPTAITLDSLSAQSGESALPLVLAATAFVLVAGAGLTLRKRYMA